MHLLPDASALPLLEVVIYRAVGGKIVGHHFPLTSRALDIEDAVENLTKVDFDWVSKTLWQR